MNRRIVHRAFAVTACTAALIISAGAGSAVAGEITRGGESLKYQPADGPPRLHGQSLCAFSGLNDEYVHAQLSEDPDDDDDFARVQNPTDGPFPGVAGYACNPVGGRQG